LAAATIGAEAPSKLASPKLKAVTAVFRVRSNVFNEYLSYLDWRITPGVNPLTLHNAVFGATIPKRPKSFVTCIYC